MSTHSRLPRAVASVLFPLAAFVATVLIVIQFATPIATQATPAAEPSTLRAAARGEAVGLESTPAVDAASVALRVPHFEENVGQLPDPTLFAVRAVGGAVAVRGDRLTFHPADPSASPVDLIFEGARAASSSGADPLGGTTSYLLVDRNELLTSRRYARVVLADLYPGIDLQLRFAGTRLEFDFLVEPGVSPDAVGIRLEGTDQLRVEGEDLLIGEGDDSIRLRTPEAFQQVDGRTVRVPASFDVVGGARIELALGSFDAALPLLIDPVVELAGWFRSSHSDRTDAMTRDKAAGITYLGGLTDVSPNGSNATMTDQVTGASAAGTQAASCGVNHMGWLAAVTDSVTSVLYVCDVQADGQVIVKAMDVGDDGNVYVAGELQNGIFLLVAHLNGQGVIEPQPWDNGSLIVEGVLGGSNFDDQIVNVRSIATIPGIQPSGGVAYYVGGHYRASGHVNGGILSGGVQCGGPVNANRGWLALEPSFPQLPFGSGDFTYCFGANASFNDDFASVTGIAVGPGDDAYIAATTMRQANFGSAAQQVGPGYAGDHEYIVARVDILAGELRPVWWRFLGGSGQERTESARVAVDGQGRVHVAGRTTSADMLSPVNAAFQAGAFTPLQGTNAGGFDGFYAILEPGGADLEYFTYAGGSNSDTLNALDVQADGSVWLAGSARDNWGATWDFSGFDDAQAQVSGSGADDSVVIQLDTDRNLVWGTYIGGGGNESPAVLTAEPSGGGTLVYVAGSTQGTPGGDPWLPSGGGVPGLHDRDGYLVRIEFPPVVTNQPPVADAGPDAAFDCTPLTGTSVTLDGSGSSDPDGDTVTYTWTEGGDTLATGESPTIDLEPGVHTITLTVNDGVNPATTDDVVITVEADTTAPEWDAIPDPVVAEATSPGGASVSLPVPTASDACSVPVVSWSPGLSTFPLGTTVVTFTAVDDAGNEATPIDLSVTVQDTTPPALALSGDIVLQGQNPAGQPVSYPAPTAADLVDGDLSAAVVCSAASGDVFPIGTTTVQCDVTDAAGNPASGSFDVTLLPDQVPPTLTVPGDLEVESTSGAGAVVDYIGDVSAVDAIDPDPVVSCAPSSGSIFGIGTTTVECTATDDFGNQASASFDVEVLAIPFEAFDVSKLSVDRKKPNRPHGLVLDAEVRLAAGADIDVATEEVLLRVGDLFVVVPGSAFEVKKDKYEFKGTVGDVEVDQLLLRRKTRGGNGPNAEVYWVVKADLEAPDLSGIANSVTVTLTIGNDVGHAVVQARIKE